MNRIILDSLFFSSFLSGHDRMRCFKYRAGYRAELHKKNPTKPVMKYRKQLYYFGILLPAEILFFLFSHLNSR